MDRDMDRIASQLAKQAKRERKQELAQEKAMKKEERRIAEPKAKQEGTQAGKSLYNVVVIAKFEYKEGEAPDEKKLAEDIARTIIKWADQKKIISIDPKEPVPELVSLDVDVQ